MHTELFDYEFNAAGALDIGKKRESNEDHVITCPGLGFFAVTDGLGGLAHGGKTSEIISEVMPEIAEGIAEEFDGMKAGPEQYGAALTDRVRQVSDNIFDTVNTASIDFGATLSCVWLIDEAAVYVNLGDSRGYLLPRYGRTLKQVTFDHNLAGELIMLGEFTKEEMRGHPASSRLTQFMGMPAPARPDLFIETVKPGDRILLCSDGLCGMLTDHEILGLIRAGRQPETTAGSLIESANRAGGYDNISVVCITVGQTRYKENTK